MREFLNRRSASWILAAYSETARARYPFISAPFVRLHHHHHSLVVHRLVDAGIHQVKPESVSSALSDCESLVHASCTGLQEDRTALRLSSRHSLRGRRSLHLRQTTLSTNSRDNVLGLLQYAPEQVFCCKSRRRSWPRNRTGKCGAFQPFIRHSAERARCICLPAQFTLATQQVGCSGPE